MKLHSNDESTPELPKDELDALLRDWHGENALRARASRDEVLRRVAPTNTVQVAERDPGWRMRRVAGAGASFRAAAALLLAVLGCTALLIMPSRSALADGGVVQVPDGGRLDAVAPDGTLIGPCPLEHTAVDAQISGFISRVTVAQRYRNTYTQKVEAVYTFPLSHRASIDRMRMIVRLGGDERVVEGEVKEREQARLIYDSARRQGFVASLLEQQRPNIFTQSVANIEPGSEVIVEISYVETLQVRDGSYTFDFPMVVGPRFVPRGGSSQGGDGPPRGLVSRNGVVLMAPAQIRVAARTQDGAVFNDVQSTQWADNRALTAPLGPAPLSGAQVLATIERGWPITEPSAAWRGATDGASDIEVTSFTARYPDGSEEPGTLRADGTGEVGGRWFWAPPERKGQGARAGARTSRGTGFAQGSDQVPDAGLVTPMPVRPPERAGHDLSLRVTIESGGPAVTDLRSELHAVDIERPSPGRAVITLDGGRTIPNRDFVLGWKLADGALAEGLLTQVVPGRDGYFLLYLVPPARVEPVSLRRRELIFVLDTSGSMKGFPIERSKQLMASLLSSMREGDTFNVITFAGDHHVLWPEPRPANAENLDAARRFVESRGSGGGTEMMAAIDAALTPTPRASQPGATADDPGAGPMRLAIFLTDGYVANDMALIDAVRRNSGTTRVFTFGIGNSVNRYLMAELAAVGRGAVDFVLQESDADAVVKLFGERVLSPVLTDISVDFGGVQTEFVSPPLAALPDLYDREPLVIVGRYPQAGRGTLRVRGMTGAGPWERTASFDFPVSQGTSTVVASLWARAQVDQILRPHLNALQQGSVPDEARHLVIRMAEEHQIMSPFTSFVAVEKTRVTLGGEAVLVPVPIELPQGVSWEGNFGSAGEVLDHLLSQHGSRDGDPSVQERLLRVRQLQVETKYDSALKETRAILAVEPDNQAALALGTIIEHAAFDRKESQLLALGLDDTDGKVTGSRTTDHDEKTTLAFESAPNFNLHERAGLEAAAAKDAAPAGDTAREAAKKSNAADETVPGRALSAPPPKAASEPAAPQNGSGSALPPVTAGPPAPEPAPAAPPAPQGAVPAPGAVPASGAVPAAGARPTATAAPDSTLGGSGVGGGGGGGSGGSGGSRSRRSSEGGEQRSRGAAMGSPVGDATGRRTESWTGAPKPGSSNAAGPGGADAARHQRSVQALMVYPEDWPKLRNPSAPGAAPAANQPVGDPAAVAPVVGQPGSAPPATAKRTDEILSSAAVAFDPLADLRTVPDRDTVHAISTAFADIQKQTMQRAMEQVAVAGDTARKSDHDPGAALAKAEEALVLSDPVTLRIHEPGALRAALVGGGPGAASLTDEDLADHIKRTIIELHGAEHWLETGGDAGRTFALAGGRVAVIHRSSMQQRIAATLDALRAMAAAPTSAVARRELPGDPGGDPLSIIDARSLLEGGDEERASDLLEIMMEAIDPESWTPVGGERAVRTLGGFILLKAPSDRAALCEQLLATMHEVERAGAAGQPLHRVLANGEQAIGVIDLRAICPMTTDARRSECMHAVIERLMADIDPEGWTAVGGDRSRARVFGTVLVVTSTPGIVERAMASLKTPEVKASNPALQPAREFTAEQLNRLQSRLDEQLLIIGLDALARSGTDESAGAPASPVAPMRVVARVESIDEAIQAALREREIQVEAKALASRVMILRVPANRLIDLGLMPGVARVDRFVDSTGGAQGSAAARPHGSPGGS